MTYPRLSWSIRRFARLLPAALALAVCLNYCPPNLQAAETAAEAQPSPRPPRRRLPVPLRLPHHQPRRTNLPLRRLRLRLRRLRLPQPPRPPHPRRRRPKARKRLRVRRVARRPNGKRPPLPEKSRPRANTMPARTPSLPKRVAGRCKPHLRCRVRSCRGSGSWPITVTRAPQRWGCWASTRRTRCCGA